MSKTNPILRAILTDDVTLQKVSGSIADSVWGTQHKTEKEYVIKAKLFIITDQDLLFERGATLSIGDARAFFKESYTIGMETVEAVVGDKVAWNGMSFQIQRTTPWVDKTIRYREAYLKRLS